MDYLKKNGWILFIAIMFDYLAISYWQTFLAGGSINSPIHGMSFSGEAMYGHLAGATLIGVFSSYYVIKSIIKFNYDNWRP